MALACMHNGNALGSGERKPMVINGYYEQNFQGAYGKENKFRLVSTDTDKHMNFVVYDLKSGPTGITLYPEQAMAVRDALIELYPVKPVQEPDEYGTREVSNGGGSSSWEVLKFYDAPAERKHVPIASVKTEADAKRIAQALNEAEGL